jgi:hypothetical protein
VSTDPLRNLLAERALDVETDRPERVREVHERVSATRRRRARSAGVLAVAALAVVLTVVVASLSDGGRAARPAPVIDPTPSPTATATTKVPSTSRLRSGVEVVEPEIRPRDVQGEQLVGHLSTTDSPGRTSELRTVLSVTTYDYRWETFCTGAPDAWFLLSIGDGGGSYGRCDGARPRPFPPPARPAGLPLRQSPPVPDDVNVRMLLTSRNPWPFLNQSCTSSPELPVCDAIEASRLADRGPAEFGFAVYEHNPPVVASFLGMGVSALAMTTDGQYLFSHGVAAASGSPELVVDLPASERARIVQAVTDAEAMMRCLRRATGTPEFRQCHELKVGLWVDDRRVNGPGHFSRDPSEVLSPGRHRVRLAVVGGDPGLIDFGVLVFEERP